MTATDPLQNGDGDPATDLLEASTMYEQAPDKGSGEGGSEETKEKENESKPDGGNGEPGKEPKNREYEEESKEKAQEDESDKGSNELNEETETESEEMPDIGSREPDEPKGKEHIPVTIEIDSDDSDDSDSDDDAEFMSLPPSPGPVNTTGDVDAVANTPAVVPEYLIERLRSLSLGGDAEPAPARQRDGSRTPTQKTITDSLDLMHSVKGMYRILDLIQEEGSGGLVDKVIISQDSLREFIESLRPESYSSLTKVDFKGLDKVTIKPVGIYGNREEIVRFLLSIGAIDEGIANKLCRADDDLSGISEPDLRSGLYTVKPHGPTAPENHIYIIYWPEATTWNDDAVSSVKRNRVTFLRYLTKLADQVIALISHDYAQSLVWGNKNDSRAIVDVKSRITDRLFTFEVAKTKEQEEDIKVRPGFRMTSAALTTFEPPARTGGDARSYKPQLLLGEVTQAFLTRQFLPSEEVSKPFYQDELSHTHISDLLKTESLVLSLDLGEDAVRTLCLLCLQERWPEESKKWIQGRTKIDRDFFAEQSREETDLQDTLRRSFPQMTEYFREAIVDEVIKIYPLFYEMFLPAQAGRVENIGTERLLDLFSIYPNMQAMYLREIQEAKICDISEKDYRRLKKRFIVLQLFLRTYRDLNGPAITALTNGIFSAKDTRNVEWVLDDHIGFAERSTSAASSSFGKFGLVASEAWSRLRGSKSLTTRTGHDWVKEAYQQSSTVKDSEFIQDLDNFASDDATLNDIKSEIKAIAQAHLSKMIDKLVKDISDQAFAIQREECRRAIQQRVSARKDMAKSLLRSNYIAEINNLSPADPRKWLLVDNVERPTTQRGQYRFTGVCTERRDPSLQCTIYPLKISAEEQHEMQLDSIFTPKPTVEQRNAVKFALPSGYNIAHIQLLENGKVLFIMFDMEKYARIYLEDFMDFPYAVHDRNPKMRLPCEKIGEKDIFLFDESKRMLVLCRRDKLELHAFVFDETFRYLQASSSANLSKWYYEYVQPATICAACFVSGNEEIFVLDSTGRVRVYSFVTLQCRPASLQLDGMPFNIWSSPDGSCLLALFIKDSLPTLTAYHMSTFGSSGGISVNIPDLPVDDVVLTSLINRNNVHLIGLDSSSQRCQSVVLDIARNVTEFMFQESGSRKKQQGRHNRNTIHNSLIDCHYDVWTRFPVLPAIERRTITSNSQRRARALVFVADEGCPAFPAYFADMIVRFRNTAKKPTGRELDDLLIHAADFESLESTLVGEIDWQISSLRAGEWLADLICLIPIHIAVCRDNRFIPLKDGVFSADLERSLLGAEVNRIVDSLSFGWYESLFQSYMASKPVKVVSSMGEQSVGKSFALNHLADTSFAGSAMRTTEGVWLSCTPTDNALIVALDFEGVHSIERSAQEDTLLVLFNTAISNLVLFRNNFALSRDITGLFQSFQSSATILDPEANPGLFQSTLLIIIKDVVDSDKLEIAREFSLKFHKIVQQEQHTNFITRLHAGKLNIIPWPVIESSEFYIQFNMLDHLLEEQPTTHHAAGEFLHTLKTLMAKLKTNDWGALSHTMAAHRAQALMVFLPKALQTGFVQMEPVPEPLKNLDTDLLIEKPDTEAQFSVASVPDSTDPDTALNVLLKDWDQASLRQHKADVEWAADLSSYLSHLVELRVDHIGEWISSNLTRFKTTHSSIEELRRAFNSASLDLKTNVQLCTSTCAHCQLLCIKLRSHDGPHDCRTSHRCIHDCGFCAKESSIKPCGMSAGHPGKHICVVNTHLCGEPCELSGKRGCLEECTKVHGHPEEQHLCAARLHMCGEPCGLSNAKLPNGRVWTCESTCCVPSHEEHSTHQCDNRLCPIPCQLCKQLCNQPHLHGLTEGETHLCGQAHSCNALCSAAGICQIETAPHSIEATFAGKHETFQYTKYTQVAKRLRCIRPIDAGALDHEGSHCHSEEHRAFHFCEARCENCGYFCTLPLGHSQHEHETSHGSMSRTRWTIDGPDGTTIDLDGRRFATNDEGAPMMCNLVCSSLGRHVHFSYCRTQDPAACGAEEVEHVSKRLLPDPDRNKDFITHKLEWRRMGFKDPYSRDEQVLFAKCDAMCPGPEHLATAGNPAQPSYCTLPMFHAPVAQDTVQAGHGHVSRDGHCYDCRDPVLMQPSFHVIFVIDRSGSMDLDDRRPLPNTPASARIAQYANNRLGAVFSALYSFWLAREAAVMADRRGYGRRDAYSVILFNYEASSPIVNDFTSSPDELLNAVLPYPADYNTSFSVALQHARSIMVDNWNVERQPIIVFLSDGIGGVNELAMRNMCQSATTLGKPLSFHAVSFGREADSATLRRMVDIALDIQDQDAVDPAAPTGPIISSSYAEALDSIRLAETFLNIAESLRKPRGSLLR